ncbi:MAG: hypothetical protein JWP87_2068 [Labilithrix sp.]|nr:hypothetical protein [Labilithrix sp.]
MYTQNVAKLRALAAHLRDTEIDGGDAFLPDYRHGFVPAKDGDVEALGEEFIAAATAADGMGEIARDEMLGEEIGALTVELFFDDPSENHERPFNSR